MRCRNFWLCMVLLFLGSPIVALIHKISIWRDTITGNRVYIMHDCHVDYVNSPLTGQQQDDICAVAQKLSAFVIFEGSLDYDGDDVLIKKHQENFRASHKTTYVLQLHCAENPIEAVFNESVVTEWHSAIADTPMFDLGKRLTELNVPCENIEFRQLLLAFRGGQPVSNERIVDMAMDKVDVIQSFADDEQCQAFYDERINHFMQHNKDILTHSFNISCFTYTFGFFKRFPLCSLLLGAWFFNTAQHYIKFSYELIDALAVHALHTHKHEKNIIIVCGGDHAKAVDSCMLTLGYVLESTHGGEVWKHAWNIRHAFCPLNIKSILFDDIPR